MNTWKVSMGFLNVCALNIPRYITEQILFQFKHPYVAEYYQNKRTCPIYWVIKFSLKSRHIHILKTIHNSHVITDKIIITQVYPTPRGDKTDPCISSYVLAYLFKVKLGDNCITVSIGQRWKIYIYLWALIWFWWYSDTRKTYPTNKMYRLWIFSIRLTRFEYMYMYIIMIENILRRKNPQKYSFNIIVPG